jgi:phosphinothricin acetyltransferase
LAPDFHTKGIGRILYETLFNLMKLQGYYNVFAGVALPNEKSVGFHQALGFQEVGIFKNVGFKHGHWHDTHWFQLMLNATSEKPLNPILIEAAAKEEQFIQIIADANELLKSKFIV